MILILLLKFFINNRKNLSNLKGALRKIDIPKLSFKT